jgi:phosphopantothenoylcysteine decarboxylase/phosphopantothenate--cysteine ligase
MMQPEDIAAHVTRPVVVPATQGSLLAGKTIMLTAGPTREALDPVRYISNRSSGKMGYALARAAANAGARVILISGPVNLDAPAGVTRIDVESAEQMLAATLTHLAAVDLFIGAAAVADYRPADVQANKIKKNNTDMSIDLVRVPDILATVAAQQNRPFTVGFAAETERVRDYALAKLNNKKLDMIVANLVGADRGFDQDNNAVDVFWHTGEKSFPMSNKRELAMDLIQLIAKCYGDRQQADPQKEPPAIAVRD